MSKVSKETSKKAEKLSNVRIDWTSVYDKRDYCITQIRQNWT